MIRLKHFAGEIDDDLCFVKNLEWLPAINLILKDHLDHVWELIETRKNVVKLWVLDVRNYELFPAG